MYKKYFPFSKIQQYSFKLTAFICILAIKTKSICDLKENLNGYTIKIKKPLIFMNLIKFVTLNNKILLL